MEGHHTSMMPQRNPRAGMLVLVAVAAVGIAILLEHLTGLYTPSRRTTPMMGLVVWVFEAIGCFWLAASSTRESWGRVGQRILIFVVAFAAASVLLQWAYLELVWRDYTSALVSFTTDALRSDGQPEEYIRRFTARQATAFTHGRLIRHQLSGILMICAVGTLLGFAVRAARQAIGGRAKAL